MPGAPEKPGWVPAQAATPCLQRGVLVLELLSPSWIKPRLPGLLLHQDFMRTDTWKGVHA